MFIGMEYKSPLYYGPHYRIKILCECQKVYYSYESLFEHQIQCTQSKQKNGYVCTTCATMLDDIYSYLIHARKCDRLELSCLCYWCEHSNLENVHKCNGCHTIQITNKHKELHEETCQFIIRNIFDED